MQRIIERSDRAVAIDVDVPTTVSSTIELSDIAGTIEHVSVTVNIFHTFTKDLKITLKSPGGKEVLLVAQEGGSGDHFIDTTFDMDSTTSILTGMPPFSGAFSPEGDLSDFNGTDPNGIWRLEIEDACHLDGGSLNYWVLSLGVDDTVLSDFIIDVRFMGGLTPGQETVVAAAAKLWSQVVVGDLPAFRVEGDVIDDVLIEMSGIYIDGPGDTLGQAGPTYLRPGSLLPIKGVIEFDKSDLKRMEDDGSLLNVIVHEMAHILGFGTLWKANNLMLGTGTENPVFTGPKAMAEFGSLMNALHPMPVPASNTGGPGTRESHWRETLFGNELMTGYLDSGINPMSKITIASLEDIGHTVNYNAADPFVLPTSLELSMMGIGAEGGYGKRQCAMAGVNRIGAVILSESERV